MTRSLRLVVLVTQVAAWALGTAGLCLCADTAVDTAGDCCERVSDPGEDCCAPARDQPTSASSRSFERAAALQMPARVAVAGFAFAVRPTWAAPLFQPPAPPRPALVLRI